MERTTLLIKLTQVKLMTPVSADETGKSHELNYFEVQDIKVFRFIPYFRKMEPVPYPLLIVLD